MPAVSRNLLTTLPKLLIVGGLVAASATLTACGPQAERNEDAEVTQAGEDDVFNIKVGDCFNEPDGDTVTTVTVVPCDEPHDDELYFEFRMSGTEYPGQAALDDAAIEQCVPQFEAFVGVPADESELSWWPFQPTKDGWEQLNDRVIQCVVVDDSGKTTGTLKGANR